MKKNKEQEAPVCGNCDQYVDRITLNKRYKRSEMICKLNGKHMNPALKAGCAYHPANRKAGVLNGENNKA